MRLFGEDIPGVSMLYVLGGTSKYSDDWGLYSPEEKTKLVKEILATTEKERTLGSEKGLETDRSVSIVTRSTMTGSWEETMYSRLTTLTGHPPLNYLDTASFSRG